MKWYGEILKVWLNYLAIFILNYFSTDILSENPSHRLRTKQATKKPQKYYFCHKWLTEKIGYSPCQFWTDSWNFSVKDQL